MKNVSLAILLFLLTHSIDALRRQGSYTHSNTINHATTTNGKDCMTGCTSHSNYHFCYTGWGSGNWEYCDGSQKSMAEVLYYTSKKEGNTAICTSRCGNFGYDYEWCFTGDGGAWDYCSTNKKSCFDCSKYSSGYQCKNQDGNFEYCSPDPIRYEIFDKAARWLENTQQCNGRKRRYTQDDIRNIGVEQIASNYENNYNQTTFPNYVIFPIRSVTTMTLPPHQYRLENSRIPLAIRAQITIDMVNNQREPIPTFINTQMEIMNALPNDERGHLLAASLGGPMHDYNFAPQSTIVNRSYGGDSYWYRVETEIRSNILNGTWHHVDWVLVVIYDDLQITRRPIGFGIRFRAYDANNVEVRDSGDMAFSNDPAGGCPI